MRNRHRTAAPGSHRPAGAIRAGLIALIAASGIVMLGAIFFGLWFSADRHGEGGEYTFETLYTNAEAPDVPATATTIQDHATITVSSYEPLTRSRILSMISTALPFLIVVAACIEVIVLASRLLGARPFTRAVQWGIALLGLLSAASAILIPWFESLAVDSAIAELGMPTSGRTADGTIHHQWVTAPLFDPLQNMLWPLFTLGATLLLISILWGQAARLQRDTEGLV